uniref:Uncharacterized protein n=1 Tax=Oryza glumipatula TaxID=40148 RepID=A0A0D9YL83_9ORYZ
MPMPHGTYRAAGAQPHAPSPHLQQLRMPSPYATSHGNQHQRPSILASLLPFVLPSSSDPSLTAPPSLNTVVHRTSGPLNAGAGSQHAGSQISGVNPSGSSASASLNTWLTARLALTSEARGTVSSTEVDLAVRVSLLHLDWARFRLDETCDASDGYVDDEVVTGEAHAAPWMD